ncbi:unnamed protein product [Protopolystoma xenopodis]|uniref:Dynein heavy chain linker domain-containing protein n=1 Tax=Protopolystoma xenopodis TaxID=117903 RepID=A0A448X2V3_9PLAT|nr:unnamed protein product [Protopolystoma xenopodis]
MPKALKEWKAYEDLSMTIDNFNETCPILEMMANKAMVSRHWERLENITGHKFEVDADNFLLRNLMEAPLLKHKEEIEVQSVCSGRHTIRLAISFTQVISRDLELF